ncbi:MAG: hypothetical protein ACKPE8_05600 [Dolichospermum sp.]
MSESGYPGLKDVQDGIFLDGLNYAQSIIKKHPEKYPKSSQKIIK